MIDWVSMVVPCEHASQIQSGQIASLRPDGTIEWSKYKRLSVLGSHDATITVRTYDGLNRYIEVSGNPTKWFQGHNLWGTNDIYGLVVELLHALIQRQELGLTPSPSDVDLWISGGIRLTRVDVTETFQLNSRSDVLAWLRAAEHSAHLPHRGRGQLTKGSTLYFGKNSRRWSLKLYSKGQEIEAKGHEQPIIERLPSAKAWAEKALRAELTLRAMELKRRGLDCLSSWRLFDIESSEVTVELLRPILGSMTMTTKSSLDASVLESLTNAQKTAYLSWVAGHDLSSVMSRPSFYRLRKILIPHGIDISVTRTEPKSNVVPMLRVLEAVPAGIPDWAEGTPLYFEPRRLKIA